jgi:hypothetical protein
MVPSVTYYHLYLAGPGGVVKDQWYPASICDAPTETCSLSGISLGGGTYSWYVQTYNPAGYGLWTNGGQPTNFTTLATVPGAATLIQPNSPIGTAYNPTYDWTKVSGATYYRLYVQAPSGAAAIDQWYLASSICNDISSTCTVGSVATPTPTLGGGTHTWYVQTYGVNGYGKWSHADGVPATTFTLDTPIIPKAVTNLSPSGTLDASPSTYIWDKVVVTDPVTQPMATWYRLYVKGPNGVVKDQWYQAATICASTDCSVPVSPALTNGSYTWWVQTYNMAGYGPWKKGTFTVAIP